MAYSETDTRAKLIDPGNHTRGWREEFICRETTLGAVEIVAGRARRRAVGRTDYTLRIQINPETQPVAVALLEAKKDTLPPGHGLDQAKGYLACSRRNVQFVYSSNGHMFVAFDRSTGMGQTRGRTGLLACEATTNQACFAVLPCQERFEPAFLQLWFRASYDRLRSLTDNRGGNQPNLSGVLLRQLEVSLPPIEQQRRIVAELSRRLDEAEKLIGHLRDELALTEALPAALLRRAFGGDGDAAGGD